MNANKLADELKLLPEKIEEWGAYASDYFKNKWDLKGDIKSAIKIVSDVETMLRQQAKDINLAKECYDKLEKENAYLLNKNDFLLAVIKEKESELAILKKANEK